MKSTITINTMEAIKRDILIKRAIQVWSEHNHRFLMNPLFAVLLLYIHDVHHASKFNQNIYNYKSKLGLGKCNPINNKYSR